MKNIFSIFSIGLITVAVTTATGFYFYGKSSTPLSATPLRVAACPSCYEIAGKLDKTRYEIIPTRSTSESIFLLNGGQVDMVLSGRSLKPGEPPLDFVALGEGYSFLGPEEISIRSNQLDDYTFFTDLDAEKIRTLFGLREVTRVDDVYEYLARGIVITSWENTNYGKAHVVHAMENDDQRLALSRRPTLYCPETCGDEIGSQFILELKEIQS